MTYDIDLSEIETLMTGKGYEMLSVKSRYLLSYGGSGSSKSYSIVQKILLRIMSEDGHRFLVARKVARSLKRSVFALFLDVINEWGIRDLFSINLSDMTFVCRANKNQIILTGLDDVEKLKSIAGVTSIWLEEATEISYDDFVQIDLRLRGHTQNYKQIIMSFNPTDAKSWLKKRFFDNVDEDATVVHSTYLDNNFIDDRYKKVLDDLIGQNKNMHDIYTLGKWGSRKGLIFDNYTLIDELPSDFEYKTFGVDFGHVHPLTMVEARVIKDAIYVKELYYKTNSLVSDLIRFMKQEQAITEDSIIKCDSANPDGIQTIKNAGFRRTVGAKKDVLSGIDFIKSKKLFVTSDSTNLIKELNTYSWMLDKSGELLEKPVKLWDDLCDSLRYAVFDNQKIKISLAKAGMKKHNAMSGYDSRLHRTASDSSFKGFE